ncbi:MAG TPA: DUF58 domain-containing protein [Thermoplasmata archaeon]|nr:DUF58 domain-containing protein [Thermoplasmata archaeon]
MSAGDPPGSSLRWTPLSYVLLGSAVLLLLVGVTLRAAAPIFVALPLFVAPIAAALSGPRRALPAQLVWEARGAESEVTIRGIVRGDAVSDLTDVELTFSRPPDLTEAAPPSVERGRGAVGFVLHWRAPYPTIAVAEPPEIVWRDPVGLVERSVKGRGVPLPIERFPPELLRLGAARLDRVLALPGETRSRRVGSAGEFYGIREASPTDPPRRINWRATARRGRLLVNEFELDRTGDVLLLLDVRSTRLGRGTDEILLGAARAAAIGIAAAFAREKARVGYASFGEFVDPVPLASGRGHRLRVQEAIRATRCSSVAGPSERCAATLPRFFPPGVTTILISSLTGDASADLVVYLRRRGYPTVVLSPSPAPLLVGDRPLAAADERLAQRLERLVRRQHLARVWVHAPVVDWEDFWSLGGFVRLMREPGRRRSV